MPRGVEIDVFAAPARTREDINYASGENLEGHLLVLLTYKSQPQGYCNNVGISLFHVLGGSLEMAAKYSLTTNTHKKYNILKVERLNYILMLNETSPVSSLTGYEYQNLLVKMVKNT